MVSVVAGDWTWQSKRPPLSCQNCNCFIRNFSCKKSTSGWIFWKVWAQITFSHIWKQSWGKVCV